MEKQIQFKKNSYLYVEGDEDSKYVYLIKSGKVSYIYNNPNLKNIFKAANPGDIVGYITSLSERPRLVSAVAVEDTVVAQFEYEEFINLLRNNIEISMKVLSSFSETLRNFNQVYNTGDFHQLTPKDQLLYQVGKEFHKAEMLKYALHVYSKFIEVYSEGMFHDLAVKAIAEIKNEGVSISRQNDMQNPILNYKNDDVIFCEQQNAVDLFIIKKGAVKIYKITDTGPALISILDNGEIFGELGIISEKPRNATAVAYGDTTLMKVNKDSLKYLLEQSEEIHKKIFISISKRVWFNLIRNESKLYSNPVTKIYVFLESKLLEDNVSFSSTNPHKFNFGLEELYKMASIRKTEQGSEIDEFLSSKEIVIHFNQITIQNPLQFIKSAKMHKKREALQ